MNTYDLLQDAGSRWVEEVLAECEPESQEAEITVGSKKLRIRLLLDEEEAVLVRKRAAEFAEAVKEKMPGAFESLTPCSAETAVKAFMLSHMSVEPNLTTADALKIARRNSLVLNQAMEQIDAAYARRSANERKEYEASKNGSGGTSAGATS